MRSRTRHAFTLVELLVVIGIIALLISILLPALNRARDSANTIKCASNLRSVGQAIALYASNNKQRVPAAYANQGYIINPGQQAPTNGVHGYVHWSYLIFGTKAVAAEAFTCPSMNNGGLPPTSPQPGNWDPGQQWEAINVGGVAPDGNTYPTVTATDGTGATATYVPDLQVPRLAFTVNEAVMGRNKHEPPVSVTRRYATSIPLSKVKQNAQTILATEFIDRSDLVSGSTGGAGANHVLKSHRPVGGWRAVGGGTITSVLDMQKIPKTTQLRKTNWTDLQMDPIANVNFRTADNLASGGNNSATRLDWVGSNHGKGKTYRDRKTNFLYCDGHVETKSLKETIPQDATSGSPWEWGVEHYTIEGFNPQ